MATFVIKMILKVMLGLLLGFFLLFLPLYLLAHQDSQSGIQLSQIILVAIILIVFSLPSLICLINKNQHSKKIIITNLASILFGLAWIVAFAWSLTKKFPNQNIEPIVTTPVGEVEPQSTQAHV